MNNLMKWNPEFVKNLWLEFSPQRLIAMPAIIGLVFLLIMVNANNDAWQVVSIAALAGVAIIGVLWGIRSAADAILDEYNERTWDWQRMNNIGPWKLTIGKLFGSTAYNWYGTILCLLIYLVAQTYVRDSNGGLRMAFLMCLSIVAVQGLVILLSLQMVRKGDGRAKIKSNRIFIMGIVLIAYLGSFLRSFIFEDHAYAANWYGISLDNTNTSILVLLFYTGWIVAGVYRSMRTELQYSDAPNWWLAFIISSVVFQFGFFVSSTDANIIGKLSMCFAAIAFQLLIMTYFLALSEPKDIVHFRLLVNSWKSKKFQLFFENIPLWLLTLPIAFAFGFLSVILFTASGNSHLFHKLEIQGYGLAYAFLFACIGFALRDLGILLLLNFSNRSKRADGAMIVYLLILYLLLPAITNSLKIGAVFYPDVNANPLAMVLLPAIEAVIVLFLLAKRWSTIGKASSAAMA